MIKPMLDSFRTSSGDEPIKETEFYTILGKQDYIDENDRPRNTEEKSTTLAKRIIIENKEQYFIKTGAYGRIFNPMGMFSEGKNDKFIARTGKKEYDFKKVNKEVFDMYIKFLSTKNLAWLNNAERALI